MRTLTEGDIRQMLFSRLAKGETQRQMADKFSVSTSYLCDFLHGRRGAGESIAKALKLKREVRYIETK